MNEEVLRIITNTIARYNIEILDIIYPKWYEQDTNADEQTNEEWEELVFNLVKEKLVS